MKSIGTPSKFDSNPALKELLHPLMGNGALYTLGALRGGPKSRSELNALCYVSQRTLYYVLEDLRNSHFVEYVPTDMKRNKKIRLTVSGRVVADMVCRLVNMQDHGKICPLCGADTAEDEYITLTSGLNEFHCHSCNGFFTALPQKTKCKGGSE